MDGVDPANRPPAPLEHGAQDAPGFDSARRRHVAGEQAGSGWRGGHRDSGGRAPLERQGWPRHGAQHVEERPLEDTDSGEALWPARVGEGFHNAGDRGGAPAPREGWERGGVESDVPGIVQGGSWRVRAGAGSDEVRDSGSKNVGNKTGSGGIGEGEGDAEPNVGGGRVGGKEGGGLDGRTGGGGREAKGGGKVGFCVSWGGQLETVRIARDATLLQATPLSPQKSIALSQVDLVPPIW